MASILVSNSLWRFWFPKIAESFAVREYDLNSRPIKAWRRSLFKVAKTLMHTPSFDQCRTEDTISLWQQEVILKDNPRGFSHLQTSSWDKLRIINIIQRCHSRNSIIRSSEGCYEERHCLLLILYDHNHLLGSCWRELCGIFDDTMDRRQSRRSQLSLHL